MVSLGFPQDEPSILLQDNMALIDTITKGDGYKTRTRHLRVRFARATEQIDQGIYIPLYCPTDMMPADPATKPFTSAADLVKLAKVCDP